MIFNDFYSVNAVDIESVFVHSYSGFLTLGITSKILYSIHTIVEENSKC